LEYSKYEGLATFTKAISCRPIFCLR